MGAFDTAIKRFKNSGLKDYIEDLVFHEKLPIMGVCIGLQIMANSSSEGFCKGLGWINGEVKMIDRNNNLLLPHMGWNEIKVEKQNSKLLLNLKL